MTSSVKYYTESQTINVDGSIVGVGDSALETAFQEFFNQGGIATRTLKILAKQNVGSQLVTETVEVIFNDGELKIGAAIVDATATILAVSAIMGLIGLTGAVTVAISAISVPVAAGVSVLWSVFWDDDVENFFDDLWGATDVHVRLVDAAGNLVEGARYRRYRDGPGDVSPREAAKDLIVVNDGHSTGFFGAPYAAPSPFGLVDEVCG